MVLMGMAMVAFAIGDCPPDPLCEAKEGKAHWLIVLTPFSGLAIFLAVRWGVSRWNRRRHS
jgi:hypothetical protein